MPQALPPQGQALEFQGVIPYPIDEGKDEWGLTPQQQVRVRVLLLGTLCKMGS